MTHGRFVYWSATTASLLLLTVPSTRAALVERSSTTTPAEIEASPPLQSAPATASPSKAVENSVVKVFATLRPPDPSKPWTKQEPNEITASGTVISGKR